MSQGLVKTYVILPGILAKALVAAAKEAEITTEVYIRQTLAENLKSYISEPFDVNMKGFDTLPITDQQEEWLKMCLEEKSVTRTSVRLSVPTNTPYVWSNKNPAFAIRFSAARAEVKNSRHIRDINDTRLHVGAT